MKKLKLAILVLTSLLLYTGLSTAQLEVEEVTFYPDRISIIEKGVMLLKEGKNFLGLIPKDVDKASTSVALNCEKAFVYSIDFGSVKKSEIYMNLKNQLEIVREKIQDISQEEEFYHKLVNAIIKKTESPRMTIEKTTKLYNLIKEQLRKLKDKKRKLSKKEKNLKEELHRLEKLKALYVWIDGGDECEIAINYTTRTGWWRPRYTVKYSQGKLVLDMKAIAYQKTGKNWNNVKVSFSTSTPVDYLNIPQVKPFFLERIRRSKKTNIFPTAVLYGKGGKALKRSRVARTEISAFYTLSDLINIANEEEKYFILKRWIWKNPTLERIAVPAITEAVYLKAQVKKPDEPLIPGEVTIIVDNLVSGSSNMVVMEKSNKLVIPLGIDEDIEVERKLVDKKIEDKWGGKIEYYIKYAISLYNDKERTVTVKVLEALPVSKDEKIHVEILKNEMIPQPASIDSNGIAIWIIKLKPKEKKKIVYSFKVKYPKDLDINANF